jgi:S1-C subfamily serine protease
MRQLLFCAILLLATTVTAAPVTNQDVIDNLQSVSVTVSVDGRGRGSGTLFTREVEPGVYKSFVWTAGHVIADLRYERSVIDKKTGSKRIVVGFKDCQIYKETIQDGRKVEQRYLDCRVVCFSNSETGDDQGLLEVRLRNYTQETTTFYLGDTIPGIGTELIHMGSFLGDIGSCSFTTGVTSQVGRLLALAPMYSEAVYDQTSAVSFPGSSGGGVFNQETGQYIGMLTAGIRDAQGFAWYVPVRRQLDWARSMNLEWAMDATVPMPNAADLKAIPLDDGR